MEGIGVSDELAGGTVWSIFNNGRGLRVRTLIRGLLTQIPQPSTFRHDYNAEEGSTGNCTSAGCSQVSRPRRGDERVLQSFLSAHTLKASN